MPNYYVMGLSFNTDQNGLAAYFASLGPVYDSRIAMDQVTGRSKGYGYVTMDEIQIERINNSELDGRTISVGLLEFQYDRAKRARQGFYYTEQEEMNTFILQVNERLHPRVCKYLLENPRFIHSIDPRKFEQLVAGIIEEFGYHVELTKSTRDGGKDIIVKNFGPVPEILYVECKRYSPHNLVNVSMIRQFHSVLSLDQVHKGIIATSSNFTTDARQLAKRIAQANIAIDLKDNTGVFSWIDLYVNHVNQKGSIYLPPPILKLF